MIKRIIAAALLAVSGTAANAAQWDFSYAAATGTVSGRIDGALQGDGNVIFVNSLTNLQFGGAPGPALPVIISSSQVYGQPATTPRLSLDGTVIDLGVCQVSCAFGEEYLVFLRPGIFAGPSIFLSTAGYGSAFGTFDTAKWNVTAVAAVPEPDNWALLITGFGLVGAVARQRRQARAV